MGGPVPLTTDDWARIRYEYESTHRTVADICAERGISDGTLRDRVRRWGWKRRSSGRVASEGPPPMVVPVIEVSDPMAQHDAPGCDDDPLDDTDALREGLKRQIEALIEEERQARPRRYLAGWEEFAAEVASRTTTRQSGPHPSRRAQKARSSG